MSIARFCPSNRIVRELFLSWILAGLFPFITLAHPGGLDAQGGHVNHKTGEYHYHRKVHAPKKATSEIIGSASVIDGDTIEIRGTRIRLFGIDAPESRQLCTRNGSPWMCGKDAAMALSDFLGRKTVHCQPVDTDRYGRTVAVCTAGDTEMNAWLVENGWAVAYPKYGGAIYLDEEQRARSQGLGIWSSEFEMPWDWRGEH
jgi:endonuclease YncB( thermonuclease family)